MPILLYHDLHLAATPLMNSCRSNGGFWILDFALDRLMKIDWYGYP
jgi:hypothetical protein